MTPDEQLRYARQVIIPEIGPAGQEKLKAARVFIAGLGGLGSPAAFYLAAAGLGGLTIVDSDRVEPGNLNRQILHATRDIGWAKPTSALEKLQALNPACHIRPVQLRISEGSMGSLLGDRTVSLEKTSGSLCTSSQTSSRPTRSRIPFTYSMSAAVSYLNLSTSAWSSSAKRLITSSRSAGVNLSEALTRATV